MPISDETRERWKKWTAVLLEKAEHLTDWEVEFVDSIDKWLSDGKDLTWRQSKALRELFEMMCNEG